MKEPFSIEDHNRAPAAKQRRPEWYSIWPGCTDEEHRQLQIADGCIPKTVAILVTATFYLVVRSVLGVDPTTLPPWAR